jgi:hypothetical protein
LTTQLRSFRHRHAALSFRVTGTVGIIRFLFRRWYRRGGVTCSATAVVAATCSCIVLVLEFNGTALGM